MQRRVQYRKLFLKLMILKAILEGATTYDELQKRLNVSKKTLRRYIKELEREKLVCITTTLRDARMKKIILRFTINARE